MENRIAEIRKLRNMTLRQLGEEVGLGDNTISRYETGRREPKLETWEKLADALGVSVPYLQGASEFSGEDLFPLGNERYSVVKKAVLAGERRDLEEDGTAEALTYFDAPGREESKQQLIIEAGNKLIKAWGIPKALEMSQKKEPFIIDLFVTGTMRQAYVDQVKNNQNAILKVLDKLEELEEMNRYASFEDRQWATRDFNVMDSSYEAGVSNALLDEVESIRKKYVREIEKLLSKYPNETSHVIETLNVTPIVNGDLDTSDKDKTLAKLATIDNGAITRHKTWLTDKQEALAWVGYALRHLPKMDDPNYADTPEGQKAVSDFIYKLLGKKLLFEEHHKD